MSLRSFSLRCFRDRFSARVLTLLVVAPADGMHDSHRGRLASVFSLIDSYRTVRVK